MRIVGNERIPIRSWGRRDYVRLCFVATSPAIEDEQKSFLCHILYDLIISKNPDRRRIVFQLAKIGKILEFAYFR